MTAAPRSTQLFIDEIEDGLARLLLGETVLSLPAALLPEGAREGDWIEMSVGVISPPPQDTEQRRKRLASGDPGGPIKL
jgi:hypothetical protein